MAAQSPIVVFDEAQLDRALASGIGKKSSAMPGAPSGEPTGRARLPIHRPRSVAASIAPICAPNFANRLPTFQRARIGC